MSDQLFSCKEISRKSYRFAKEYSKSKGFSGTDFKKRVSIFLNRKDHIRRCSLHQHLFTLYILKANSFPYFAVDCILLVRALVRIPCLPKEPPFPEKINTLEPWLSFANRW